MSDEERRPDVRVPLPPGATGARVYRGDGSFIGEYPATESVPETKVEPALSAEEWASVEALDKRERLVAVGDMFRAFTFGADVPRAMAVLNAALPDTDPRKITREKLDALASIIESAQERTLDPEPASRAFLDALESYLPPA